MISQNNHRNKIEELLKLFVFVGTQVDKTLWKSYGFWQKKIIWSRSFSSKANEQKKKCSVKF
jgi:hypothetical protein